MALISYVEILIEMEGCEINYNQRKAKAEKRKIERQIYEEHQHRLERMKNTSTLLKQKNSPLMPSAWSTTFSKRPKKIPTARKKFLRTIPQPMPRLKLTRFRRAFSE